MRVLAVIISAILPYPVLAAAAPSAAASTHPTNKPSRGSVLRRAYDSVAGALRLSRGQPSVKEGTTAYLFNNPVYGSEFGSLSAGSSSRENPKKIKVRPWSQLPSAARLQVTSKGFVEAGSIGLEFDREVPIWNGDSHHFLRLRSATCPPLQHLMSPLDEGSEWSVAGARPEDIMAVVFPVAKLENEDQVHGKKQRHDGESERTSGVGGMYEIRVNGKSHDALRDAIKLLYTVLPEPSWARMTAALSSRVTANEYLALATCFHIRGGNSLLRTPLPASSHPVDREKWMNFFNVRDVGGRGNKFSHLLVEGYTYSPPRGSHEGGSTAMSGHSDILREAIGHRPPSNSLKVRRKRWSRTIFTAEGELEFDLNQYGLLVLKDASCPRLNRPTPRKLSTRLALSLFPAIFDDQATFAHGSASLPGILVSAGLTGDVQSALQTLLTIVRKPLLDVNYTGNANTAGNEFLLAALCSNLIANSPPVLEKEKPLDNPASSSSSSRSSMNTITQVVDDSTITTWGYRSIEATFPYMAAQRKDIPDVTSLSVRHNIVYDPRSRFWIQFGTTLEADGNEFLILRSALCPFRNELAYGVSNLILTEVKRAVDYNAQAFPLSFPEASQTAREKGGVEKFLFHTRQNRDLIEDSIKSLYVLMGGLPWKDTENRAEYSANGHFVHVMCVHLRGYTHSIPYREDTGMPAGAVKKKAGLDPGKSVFGIFAKKRTEEDKPEPLSGWIEEFKVVEPPSATEFDSWPPQEYLMLR
ncbi:hypothetical protein FOZ61_007776, partial [Perkinsus olseni]